MGLALRAVLARRVRAGELSLEAAGVLYQRFETMLADKLREVAGTRRAPAVELEVRRRYVTVSRARPCDSRV